MMADKFEGIFRDKNITVGLISPSRGANETNLNKAIERLNYLGIRNIIYSKNILNKELSYWAGNANARAKEIEEFFENDSIDVIWCINGGLTSLELNSLVDYDKVSKNKKLFIGHSDITSLQQFFLVHSGLETVQYFMPGTNWMHTDSEFNYLLNIFSFDDCVFNFSENNVHRGGLVSGGLVGGCLDMLCSTIGTSYEIETREKIFYIEDANINPQRLYQDLCHLYLAGKFNSIKALMIAKMNNCGNYKEFLEKFLLKLDFLNVPIIKELDSGHSKYRFPLFIGGKCYIDTKKKEVVTGFSDSFKSNVRRPFHSS